MDSRWEMARTADASVVMVIFRRLLGRVIAPLATVLESSGRTTRHENSRCPSNGFDCGSNFSETDQLNAVWYGATGRTPDTMTQTLTP